MTQYARPDSDITNQGDAWTGAGAPSNTLYTEIDGTSAGSDNVNGQDGDCSGDGVEFEVGLSDVDDPSSSSSHAFKARVRVDDADAGAAMRIRLMEGSTTRATKNFSPDATSAPGALITHNLSTSEANSISNYDNLRLEFVAYDDECMGVTFYVYQAWFECPDAAAPVAAANGKAFMLFLDT
jgi:hypothetical protein